MATKQVASEANVLASRYVWRADGLLRQAAPLIDQSVIYAHASETKRTDTIRKLEKAKRELVKQMGILTTCALELAMDADCYSARTERG